MPYDNETGEFWLNEEERDWVVTHPETWKAFLFNPEYRVKNEPPSPHSLSARVRGDLMREAHITYQPDGVYFDGLKGFSLPNTHKLIKLVQVHRKWDGGAKAHVIDRILLIPVRGKVGEVIEAHPDDFKDAVFENFGEHKNAVLRLPNVTAKLKTRNGGAKQTFTMKLEGLRRC